MVYPQRLSFFQKDIIIASQRLLAHHSGNLSENSHVILHGAKSVLSGSREKLMLMEQNIVNASKSLLSEYSKKLLHWDAAILTGAKIAVNNKKNDLRASSTNLQQVTTAYLKGQHAKIENFGMSVRLMSPSNILKKGYAIIKVDGQVVSSADAIEKGTAIDILLSDTILHSIVKEKNKHDGTDVNL